VSIVAIVLAGGASSRFGTDKLAADFDGRPVLHHALEVVAATCNYVILVVAPDAPTPSLPASLREMVALARDDVAHDGPLAGLAAGLAACPPDDEVAIVVGGDMPTLQADVLRLLEEALDADAALGAATLEADPPSVLPMAVRPSVAAPEVAALLAANRRALRGLLAAVPSVVVPAAQWRALDPDGRTLRDIDTPEDLANS
jgi:molybdopterin-guanine dinucleotide biosynthesis protein A